MPEAGGKKYRLLLTTGQQMLTVDAYPTESELRSDVRRGLSIDCLTDAVHGDDRKRWTVNGDHVVAWRPIR